MIISYFYHFAQKRFYQQQQIGNLSWEDGFLWEIFFIKKGPSKIRPTAFCFLFNIRDHVVEEGCYHCIYLFLDYELEVETSNIDEAGTMHHGWVYIEGERGNKKYKMHNSKMDKKLRK